MIMNHGLADIGPDDYLFPFMGASSQPCLTRGALAADYRYTHFSYQYRKPIRASRPWRQEKVKKTKFCCRQHWLN